MSDAPRSTDELAPLWRDILADLRDVFDVHFVCATFAYHAARYTRTRALVAVADSQAKCYDVWLTEPSGRATQMRWLIDEAGLESLVALNEPTPIDKLERPAAEIIGGQIWLLVKRRLLAAPLPREQRLYSAFPPALLTLLDPAVGDLARDGSQELLVPRPVELGAAEVAAIAPQLPELAETGIYYFIDGMTHAEIARIVGCSERTVGNRIERIRKAAEAATKGAP